MATEGAVSMAKMEEGATSQGMQAPAKGWTEKKTGFLTVPEKGK